MVEVKIEEWLVQGAGSMCRMMHYMGQVEILLLLEIAPIQLLSFKHSLVHIWYNFKKL